MKLLSYIFLILTFTYPNITWAISEESDRELDNFLKSFLPKVVPVLNGNDPDAFYGHDFVIANKDCFNGLLKKSEEDWEKYASVKCKKSKSKVFKNKDPFEVIEIDITSDFKKLNGLFLSTTNAVATIKGTNDESDEVIPLKLGLRGNSRGQYCDWKPERWTFISPEDQNKVKDLVGERKPDEDAAAYQKRFYEKFKDSNYTTSKNKEGFFSSLGDDIKLVTHCGKAGWEPISADTAEGQRERVLKEFVVYQMLDEMKSSVIKTRLLEVTYRDPNGNVLTKQQAFFREPRGQMAKRCGYFNREDVNSSGNRNETSAFQADLFNRFTYTMDYSHGGHNMAVLYDQNGDTVFGPYDYDLSGIFAQDYFKNRGGAKEGVKKFKSWLNGYKGQKMAIVQAHKLLSKKENMLKVVESSPMKEESKKQFREWHDLYFNVLEDFVEESRAQEKELVESLDLRNELEKAKVIKKLHEPKSVE